MLRLGDLKQNASKQSCARPQALAQLAPSSNHCSGREYKSGNLALPLTELYRPNASSI